MNFTLNNCVNNHLLPEVTPITSNAKNKMKRSEFSQCIVCTVRNKAFYWVH